MLRKSSLIVVLFSLVAASGQAATLSNVEGEVFINSGNGFQPAAGGMVLSPGVRVRTTSGTVDIVYDNGCSIRLRPNHTAMVLSSSPACGNSGGGGAGLAAAAQPSTDYLTVAGILAFDTGVTAGAIAGSRNSGNSADPANAIPSSLSTRPASP